MTTTPPPETVPFTAAVAASGPVRRAAWPTGRHWVLAGVIALALVLPFLFQGFVTFQLTEVMIYGLAILGLNLLTGYSGQFSVGHGAFYGLGAYVTAIMMQRWGVPYYWTLPAAGGVCFIVGFLFGLPALRLQGLYLALVTFAAAVAVPQLLKFHGLEGWTGGVQGIVVDQPDAPAFLHIDADQWLYYFTLAVVLVMFAGAANLVKSRTGRAIMAIRDHPIAATAMGINAPLYKTLTFGVSALYTGVAGALGALAVQFVAPDSFSLFLSIYFLVGLILGGMGSLPGCLFGG
jgi:branched-chain amino acid transport system permease protein